MAHDPLVGAASSEHAAKPVTPQTVQARSDQVKNNAGGFVFQITPAQQLRRFLILGTTGNTYYQKEEDLTKMNVDAVAAFIKSNPAEALDIIFEISDGGLALRQNPTLFALAMIFKYADLDTRRRAADLAPRIARTGTMVLKLASYIDFLGGWSRVKRRAIANWFLSKNPQSLAYQATKYNQREGWSLRDLLRVSHPATDDQNMKDVFDVICGRKNPMELASIGENALTGSAIASTRETVPEITSVIESYNLPWEALDPKWLNEADVWAQLLNSTGYEALLRNLNRLTYIDYLKPMGANVDRVVNMILNEDEIRKSRVHPFRIYVAARTYAMGRGAKGNKTWTPVPQILAALDKAYLKAFKYVEPTGKRIFHACDVSGSMSGAQTSLPGINCMEAEMALVLPMLAAEPNYFSASFSCSGGRGSGWGRMKEGGNPDEFMRPMNLNPQSGIQASMRVANEHGRTMSGTDCSLPMLYAQKHKLDVDMFVVYTDNETWAGSIQPYQALRDYRNSSGIPDAKLMVVAMTPSPFSIADPKDPGMMDVVGLDASLPQLMSNFAKGNI